MVDHAILVGDDGLISHVLPTDEMDAVVAGLKAGGATIDTEVDCGGRAVLPGFVDAHTHAVFSGDRCHEMKMKLAGATYVDVHKAGGGINFTVRHTKASSEEELAHLLSSRLDRMIAGGTTTVEVKSGYGLEVETEMKMLRVIHSVNSAHAMDVVSTFCGAHSVPVGMTADEATEDVVAVQIPELVRQRAAGAIDPANIDVFCEKGFFSVEQSRRILQAGKDVGLAINFHGDELNPMQSGELGAALGARAISHLEHVSDEGMAAMAERNVFAVLLPTTAYVLRIAPPPARKLIAAGVPVALGSDFNPNAHCLTMPFVMNLACVTMRMTMNEALVAATVNSAAALNVGHLCGSLDVGKYGDIVVIDHPSWEHVIYEMGDGVPIFNVFKRGAKVK